ncbi:unnamed protein product [Moneuplotes crassus]|uniref:Uncharacterized protein n=1 Tax=Euplotes crassus TaxID=5936 RepID=A0AAD1Y394_EUPCR|nr:unnamed protein product [Moneuplotes crassus]
MGCGRSTQAVDADWDPEEQDEEFDREVGKKGFFAEAARKLKKKWKRCFTKESKVQIPTEYENLFEKIDMGDGDEFMAVLPWKGAIHAPDDPPKFNKQPPDERYKLLAAYGVRTEETRENIHFNHKGKVVYMTAAIGIINDHENRRQTFFGGDEVPMEAKNIAKSLKSHTDDILCLNLNHDRTLVASGQIGHKPFVYIWDSDTAQMKTQGRLDPGSRGVTSITFSPDSKSIACIDGTDDHNLCLFMVSNGKQYFKIQTGKDKMLDIAWGKTPAKSSVICVVGKRAIKIIIDKNSKFEESKVAKATIKASYRTDYASCDFTDDGMLLVGTRKGKIYKLTVDSYTYAFSKSIGAHKKTVNCITVLDKIFLSGGNDKKIIIWNLAKLKKIKMIDTEAHVRSVDYLGETLLYSTSTGTIVKKKIKIQDNEKFIDEEDDDIVMKSHNNGEAWGVAVHKNKIYTVGDDNQLIVWDMVRREVSEAYTLWTKENEKKEGVKQKTKKNRSMKKMTASSMSNKKPFYQARAIAINPHEKHMAIAFNDCKIVIKHLYNLDEHIHVIYDPKEWCECLEYNPSMTKLAAGSHDNNIYIYDISDHGYSFYCVLKGHNSYISSLDWSDDGAFIRSNCGAYELLFFDVENKEQDKSGASNLKNTEWQTQNCKLAWNVQGIYPPGTDGTHINGVAKFKERNLLVTGDDYGLINLYRDPCKEDFSKARSYRGHSEHVVRVLFSETAKYIISIGGYDQTILQWKLEGEDTDEEIDEEDEHEEEKVQPNQELEYENYTDDDTDSNDDEALQNESGENKKEEKLIKPKKTKKPKKNVKPKKPDSDLEESKESQINSKEKGANDSKQGLKQEWSRSKLSNSRLTDKLDGENTPIRTESREDGKPPFDSEVDPINKDEEDIE